jgi:3'(2'), 5'-bisphosphate nucleotidase
MHHSIFLLDVVYAALWAGKAILEVYQGEFAVETKTDNSPLTLADKQSHEIIKSRLEPHRIPFISEEGREIPYALRKQWDRVWIVDPLDGTKEFVKRNGEFTVNIALIENQRPVMGVVYAPVPRWLYFASTETGAFKLSDVDIDAMDPDAGLDTLMGMARKLPLDTQARPSVYTIVGSRSHATPELAEFVERKRLEQGTMEFIQAGSSLKICLVAEGAAHMYPRLGPTMEWDTAAGQAVAECAGAAVLVYEKDQPLGYNKPDLLNPWFIVERRAG